MLTPDHGATIAAPYYAVAFTLEVTPTNTAAVRRRLHEAFQILAQPPRRVSISEMRQEFAAVIEWSAESGRPVIISNHGKPQAVLLSFAVFEQALRRLAKEVLTFGSRRSAARVKAADVVDSELTAITKRLRGGGVGA